MKRLMLSVCLLIALFVIPTSYAIVLISKAIGINAIQINPSVDNKPIIGFSIYNIPWQPNPYTNRLNAYLLCGQGVFPAKSGDQTPTANSKDLWNSLTEWQRRWLTAQNIKFSTNQVTSPNLTIACLAGNKIKIQAKPFNASTSPYRALLNSLTPQNQSDYPFAMSTPPETPSFYSPNQIPPELTPQFYENAYSSLSFAINNQLTLMIITQNNTLSGYQVRCAMHCRPVVDLAKNVEVYITQNGSKHWIMRQGKTQNVPFDPSKPFTLSVNTNYKVNNDLSWQHLTIDYQQGSLIYWRNQHYKYEAI